MKITKKFFSTAIACCLCVNGLFAGGILTNTNQSAHFLRNPARGASMEIDAVYTNPAGLAKLSHNGFHFTLNNQSAFQTRTITSTFAPFAMNGGNATKAFKGDASAIVIPSFMAAYKTGDWVISGSFAIVGGGGSMIFKDGLPSFESQIAAPVAQLSNAAGIPTTYSLNSRLEGSSMNLGVQLGATYAINEMFSIYLGGRLNIVNNGYNGYLNNVNIARANDLTGFFNTAAAFSREAANSFQPIIDGGAGNFTMNQLVSTGQLSQSQIDQMATGLGISSEHLGALTVIQTQGAFNSAAAQADGAVAGVAQIGGTDLKLDAKQTGMGVTPIIGFNFNWERLNIGVKYEFITKLNVENSTKVNTTGVVDFDDKVKTPHDIPAFLAIGTQYDIFSCVTISAGFHQFFDSKAKMANDKQKYINGGNTEYLLGAEWRINPKFLVSAGGQITRTGVTDNYQTDLSYSLNSYSIGFGGAMNVTEKIRINAGYFFTVFEDWTDKRVWIGGIPPINTYARTNNVFGVGVDFRF
jgi:hypothetical protein